MAVADALVSKVLEMLVSTISKEFRLLSGVEQEVEKLTFSIQSIQVVLVDAERRQLKEATVQLWLDRLKSVAYDIDDVMDQWSYEILRSQIEREENTHKPTSKVRSFSLLSAFYCFPKAVSRHHMAVKISHLNARLDLIAIEKDRYGFHSSGNNIEHVERSITTSHISISEVKGRDIDKEKIVSMLLAATSEMSNLRLIPLVGMGGIGKTTLARLVYNDERVKSHFHKRIWLCVSDPFDEIRIAKEILESLQGANSNLDAFPNIMKKIQESFVEGEEYLFVLDDVWNEDPRKWKQLEDCLRGSLSKSRILVATRNENVGRIMGCLESDVFRVRLLSDKKSWELFCMVAFFRRSDEERKSLEEMGKEIVRRCKGLPLAVRTIAGVLQFKKRRIEWQSVLDSELWDSDDVQRDIAAPLWLSYYDLPPPLKQCFLYYAVFPKNYEIEKVELIRHWMAQGYIRGTKSKDVETIGDEYFQNLLMRSLFQKANVDRTRCKMHDMVHDFAQLLVKNECLSVRVNNDTETICLDDSLGNSLRHLSISFISKVPCLDLVYNLKKLRSLIFSPSESWYRSMIRGPSLHEIFNEFTFLRSLILSKCDIAHVPSNINRLIHLRELDLSDNHFLKELPGTIWELYNLQILNLRGNYRIQSVKGIGRLTNLGHLGNPHKSLLLPNEMMRLSGLRRLNWVNINVDNDEAFSLKHLKNFNQLGESFEIRWLKRGDGDVEDAKQAHLKDKKRITRLVLYFTVEETEMRKKQDEELIEALNVPPNLETLQIEDYMGSRNPNWLNSLTFVKILHLHSWKNCEHLPSLGILPCLGDLRFQKCCNVVKVGTEFLGSTSSTIVPLFPKLTYLSFYEFVDWEEWNDVDEDKEMSIMPSLTSLYLTSCPKLKALPNFVLKKTSLKLEIQYCRSLKQSKS